MDAERPVSRSHAERGNENKLSFVVACGLNELPRSKLRSIIGRKKFFFLRMDEEYVGMNPFLCDISLVPFAMF